MAAIARAAIDPRAGMFMTAAEEEVEAVADLMADEAWLAMELIPEAAELMMELTVGLRVTVVIVFVTESEGLRGMSSIYTPPWLTSSNSCLATPKKESAGAIKTNLDKV